MSKLPYVTGVFFGLLATAVLINQAAVASGAPGADTVNDRINHAN